MHKIVFIRAKEPGKLRLNEGVFGSYKNKRTEEDKKKDAKKEIQKIYDNEFKKKLTEIYVDMISHSERWKKAYKMIQNGLYGFGMSLIDKELGIMNSYDNLDDEYVKPEDMTYDTVAYTIKGAESIVTGKSGENTIRNIKILLHVSTFRNDIFTRTSIYCIDSLEAYLAEMNKLISNGVKTRALFKEFGCNGNIEVKFKFIPNPDDENLGVGIEDYGRFSSETLERFFSLFDDFYLENKGVYIVRPFNILNSEVNAKKFEDVISKYIKINDVLRFSMVNKDSIEDIPHNAKMFSGYGEGRIFLSFNTKTANDYTFIGKMKSILKGVFSGNLTSKNQKIDKVLVNLFGMTYDDMIMKYTPWRQVFKKLEYKELPYKLSKEGENAKTLGPVMEELVKSGMFYITTLSFSYKDPKGTLKVNVKIPSRKSDYKV